MKKALRVLMVEDSKDDAFLIMRELRRSGCASVFERVDTAEDIRVALDEQEWDVIISDYSMPSFSGSDALEVLKEHGLDIPFILVSGKIGEETAVEIMRAGAHDFVRKDALFRLVPAVERGIREAEMRREHHETQEALRESEEKFKSVFENVPTGIYRTSPDGQILMANPALVHMLGYTSPEDLGTRNLEKNGFYFSLSRRRFKELIEKEGEIKDFESVWKRRDGSLIHVRENAKAIREEDGGVLYYEGTVEDITERKQAEKAQEKSEEKYRNLIEKAEDGIFIRQGKRFVYVNDSLCKMFGYQRNEIGSIDNFLELVADESREFILARDEKLTKGEGISPQYEFVGKTKHGEKIYLSGTITPIDYNGKPARQGIVRDITEQKEHERHLQNVIVNTSHLINTPLTVASGHMDLVRMGLKEMTPELAHTVHEKLQNIRELVIEGLTKNITLLTEETHDGWTPVRKKGVS